MALRFERLFPLAALLLFTFGCSARNASVRALAPHDTGQLRAQGIPALYFVPFDYSAVVLKGDHGEGRTIVENESKWFSHVVAGAQLAFDDAKTPTAAIFVTPAASPYDAEVMDKLKVLFRYSPGVPPNAVVVTGRYLVSDNVGGAGRAMLGMMMGKTFTRAQIRIMRGGSVICDATLDGTYLGGGYSWGYETLGANEALGRIVVELIRKFQSGEPVEIESGMAASPNAG